MKKYFFLPLFMYAYHSHAMQAELALVIGHDGLPKTITLPSYACLNSVQAVKHEPVDENYVKTIVRHLPEDLAFIVARWPNSISKQISVFPDKIFLLGASGSGKVFSAQALAQEYGFPCYTCDMNYHSYRLYWNNLEAAFDTAAELNKPCMLIFKDIENLISRKDTDCEGISVILSMIKRYEKSEKIIFVLTASSLEDFSTNLRMKLRGRGFFFYNIALPSGDQRKAALDFYIRQYEGKKIDSSVDWQELSCKLTRRTEGFDYREIKALVDHAFSDYSTASVGVNNFLEALGAAETDHWQHASLYQKIKIITQKYTAVLFVTGIGIVVIILKQWNHR